MLHLNRAMAHVLVTGSAGAVGKPVCAELLRRGHRVRGIDRVATAWLEDGVVADITDPEAMRSAAHGVDAIVHLAAQPDEAPFAKLLGPNVAGVYSVMSAARAEGVARVVLASTLQIVWSRKREERGGPARVDEANPSNHYALTKLWAEQMGEMYARCHGLSVIALRLTWMVRNPYEARKIQMLGALDLYVSQRDTGRAFASAVEAPAIPFAVVYVAGPDAAPLFDLEPARRLIGFEPQDRFPDGLGFEVPKMPEIPEGLELPDEGQRADSTTVAIDRGGSATTEPGPSEP
jgi:NAD(P)-dependent dehydrogenase (short-subunit alcohol dehydrogenase family)